MSNEVSLHIVQLDASSWATVLDFYKALLAGIDAPHWHGTSPDALIDSMIWEDINGLEAPYIVQIIGLRNAPEEVRDYVALIRNLLFKAREESIATGRGDVNVSLEWIDRR